MQTLLQVSLKSAGNWLQQLKDQVVALAPSLAGALIVLIVGLWLIRLVHKMLSKIMARRLYDSSLQSFLLSLFKGILNVLLIITVAGMIGINTTSFAALMAGAGLAIGAALNGSLGNLAGGVMMLIFKPFKVGDLIEAQGAIGGVQHIGIFSTTLLSAENKTIIVPNGPLSTGVIINYTTAGYLRVDISLAIGVALNGSLGNLAGGVMMLIFKPFKVGDLIEAQGAIGGVQHIGIFSTTLLSAENKTIIVPNGPLSTGIIINYTTAGYLRVDINLAIAPNMDIDKARRVAIEAMLTHDKVLKDPAPEVAVQKIGDGMITLAVRPYCKQGDYWVVNFEIQELVYKAWGAGGIEGPTPHRVIVSKTVQSAANLPTFG